MENRNIALNKDLYLTYPEGYHLMTLDECKSINLTAQGEGIAIGDAGLQNIIVIGWQNTILGSMMMNADDVARNMANTLGMGMKGANYQHSDLVQKSFGGVGGYGFSFAYDAQGVRKMGLSFVVEKGKSFYYFNFYGDSNTQAETARIAEEVLSSIKWGSV
ncbi:MAG: hypothetical protein IKD69_12690 [Solobacterium sp.]|nr:hypothetical protein [Solobacterium sp.]